jgi:uncharacterized protein YcbK (DUF882 family)
MLVCRLAVCDSAGHSKDIPMKLSTSFAAALALAVLAPALSTSASARGGDGTSRGCLTSEMRGLLSRVESKFGAMQLISTCRPGARIASTGKVSKHASGQAVDFNAGNRKGDVVRWLLANHHSGGTMTYRGMSHIHIDVGYRFVSLNSSSRG